MPDDIYDILEKCSFTVKDVSYIGNPKPNTAVFVTKKVQNLLNNLVNVNNCLVFVENGIKCSDFIKRKHYFVYSDNPQNQYANFANLIYKERIKKERKKKYIYEQGYYIGENVTIGENAYIEPGCLLGHGVSIGKNACIFAGTVIKNTIIGDNFLSNEHAVIGAAGFTMAEDINGNKFRIPTLGGVRIGNNVEIGACDNISCGSGNDTIIEDFVKIDALVYIGHDAHIGKNVEITAGSIVGGFTGIDECSFLGINSCIRNRIDIAENSVIGMGAVVTKNVLPNMTVIGNPAVKM